MGIKVEQFIKEHNHINYCEAIIDKYGFVENVKPNHIQTLIRQTNLPEDLIWAMMPIYESPIHWLVEFTGCIAVWYDMLLKPKKGITIEQKNSIQKMINAKILSEGVRNI